MNNLDIRNILNVCKNFEEFYNMKVSDYCIGVEEFDDPILKNTRILCKEVKERCLNLLNLYEVESDKEIGKQYLNYFTKILKELD